MGINVIGAPAPARPSGGIPALRGDYWLWDATPGELTANNMAIGTSVGYSRRLGRNCYVNQNGSGTATQVLMGATAATAATSAGVTAGAPVIATSNSSGVFAGLRLEAWMYWHRYSNAGSATMRWSSIYSSESTEGYTTFAEIYFGSNGIPYCDLYPVGGGAATTYTGTTLTTGMGTARAAWFKTTLLVNPAGTTAQYLINDTLIATDTTVVTGSFNQQTTSTTAYIHRGMTPIMVLTASTGAGQGGWPAITNVRIAYT